MSVSLVFAATFASWLGHAANPTYVADAESDAPSQANDATPTLTGRVELGVFAGDRDEGQLASVSPLVHLGLRPRPEVELGATMGMSTFHVRDASGVHRQASPTNLHFGFRAIHERTDEIVRLAYLGFGFSLPTALSADTLAVSSQTYARASRGGWDPWLWHAATLGIVVPAGVRFVPVGKLVIGVDTAFAGLFGASRTAERPVFAAQVAGTVRYAFRFFGIGVRVQEVYDGKDSVGRSQASVAPELDANLCRRSAARRIQGTVGDGTVDCPLRLAARVNVNLDQPYGFIGDGARVWGLQLGLGWTVF